MHTFEIENDGLLSFDCDPDNYGARFLSLAGEPLFSTSSGCGTCQTFFERLREVATPMTGRELSRALASDLSVVSQDLIDTVKPLLPRGRYLVGLLRFFPELVRHPDVDVDGARVSYHWRGRSLCHEVAYRVARHDMIDEERIAHITEHEVLHPHLAFGAIDKACVMRYMGQVGVPTALALSVVETRYPQGLRTVHSLTHFLLDGHHKTMAASDYVRPIQLLSFLNLSACDRPLDELSVRRTAEYSLRRLSAAEIERGAPMRQS